MEVSAPLEHLLKVVDQYYARGPIGPDYIFEGFWETEEHRRLVAARIHAGTESGQWRALLDRLQARFPDAVENRSYHLPTGTCDAGYMGKVTLPQFAPNVDTDLTFVVSFLVPYYAIFRQRWVLPPGVPPPSLDDEEPSGVMAENSLEFTEQEEPYARAIGEEIEAIFVGHSPMPIALGKTVVQDVWLEPGQCGAPLFHYLFSPLVPVDGS